MPTTPGREDVQVPDLDLCEYVVVTAPSIDELEPVAAAVGDLVRGGAVHLLDVAVLERPPGGTSVHTHEVGEVVSLRGLVDASAGPAGLSQHDLDLAAVTLPPGSAAVVLVLEDRWAGSLSAAVRDVGGRVAAGERIGRERLRAQLEQPEDPRPERADLLARRPSDGSLAPQLIDPTDQIRTLADLFDHGVLSLEQYEVQRRRVLEA